MGVSGVGIRHHVDSGVTAEEGADFTAPDNVTISLKCDGSPDVQVTVAAPIPARQLRDSDESIIVAIGELSDSMTLNGIKARHTITTSR